MRSKYILICMIYLLCFSACGKSLQQNKVESDEVYKEDYIVVGFSQLGAESDWRSANTESIKKSLSRENGFELIIENGQQKQANQIMAIRTFIQKEVDIIVLAPVTETGWDTVLQEAKDAEIPVIVIDRMVDVKDDSLYTCWIGSDFVLEGNKVTDWLHNYLKENEIELEQIHIANIQGTLGASAQIGRTKALETAARKYGWDVVAQVSGDFTQTKGREVMAKLLEEYEEINVVYCENDNEARGAILAIEEAGKTAGTNLNRGEILILSFDGVSQNAKELLKEGKIGCIAECNPDHGPRVLEIIRQITSGEQPLKEYYVTEGMLLKEDLEE